MDMFVSTSDINQLFLHVSPFKCDWMDWFVSIQYFSFCIIYYNGEYTILDKNTSVKNKKKISFIYIIFLICVGSLIIEPREVYTYMAR